MSREPVWKRVLSALGLGPLTMSQLAKMLSVTQQSISLALAWCMKHGYVVRKGYKHYKHGQPARLYRLAMP